mmetsp:Transcript_5552/g.10941  ORF Transcript_5552/g.10941 Transcript_5552/m.10941 type:complete len:697 (-) Transcript_5552:355-2445(-)
MGYCKKTLRRSAGGRAPAKQLKNDRKSFRKYMTAGQKVGTADYGSGKKKKKTSCVDYENTFFAHGFKTAVNPSESKDFAPRYSVACTRNPENGAVEFWTAMYFASKFNGKGIEMYGRRGVDLVLVCDVSGSMGLSFKGDSQRSYGGKTKLEVLKRSINTIMAQLRKGDRLSVVVFNHRPSTIIDLTPIETLDKKSLEESIDRLTSSGGTHLAEGLAAGLSQLGFRHDEDEEAAGEDAAPQQAKKLGLEENVKRTYFLTDMDSNLKDEKEVLEYIQKAAGNGMFTTVVGIDVDLSVGCTQKISCTSGCRYMSVSSIEEAQKTLIRDFPYEVSPIATEIHVHFAGTSILKGFGSSELLSIKPGQHKFRLSGEFASAITGNEAMGGVYLFKTQRPIDQKSNSITVKLAWKDSKLQQESHTATLSFPKAEEGGWYSDDDIRKAICLVHYVDLQEDYVQDESLDEDSSVTGRSKEQERELHERWFKRLATFRHVFDYHMDKVNESPERRLYILDTLKQMCAYEMKDIERLGGNAKALQAEIDGNAQDLKDKLIAAESGAPLSAKADPEPSLTKSSESLDFEVVDLPEGDVDDKDFKQQPSVSLDDATKVEAHASLISKAAISHIAKRGADLDGSIVKIDRDTIPVDDNSKEEQDLKESIVKVERATPMDDSDFAQAKKDVKGSNQKRGSMMGWIASSIGLQ